MAEFNIKEADVELTRDVKYYNKLSANDILLPCVFGEEAGLNHQLIFSDAWILEQIM